MQMDDVVIKKNVARTWVLWILVPDCLGVAVPKLNILCNFKSKETTNKTKLPLVRHGSHQQIIPVAWRLKRPKPKSTN